MSGFVNIVEMGPRDGLQNETRLISTQDKVRLVDLLSPCGFQKIEVASFVSPKWVPQMADGAEVLAAIQRKDDVRYSALTPNIKGLERAKRRRWMKLRFCLCVRGIFPGQYQLFNCAKSGSFCTGG